MRKIIKTTSSSSIYISDDDLVEITNTLKKFNLHKTVVDNQWNIPTGIVGQIITNNLKIIVNPKIPYLETIDYLRLLIEDDNISNDKDSNYGFDDNENLSKFLIENFLFELKKFIKDGIPKIYKNKSIDTNYFIGNVDFTKTHLRYSLGIKPIVSTIIEELNNDYFNTRVIKSAYEKIIKMSAKYKSPSITNALYGINNTPVKRVSSKEYKIQHNRNNTSFLKTFKLAVLVLNDMNTAHKQDDYNISLLVNANKIFEDFVYNLLSVNFPKDNFEKQFSSVAAKSNKKELISRPDIIFRGSHDVIMDVKNKNFDKSITSENFHQMMSYKKTFCLKTSVLIYPYFKDADEEMYKITNDDNLKIYAISIDIKNGNYIPFLEQIEKILRFS